MFSPAVSIVFAKKPDTLPEGFLEDRAKFSGRMLALLHVEHGCIGRPVLTLADPNAGHRPAHYAGS